MGNRVTILLLMLLLSACQTTPGVPTPIGPVTRPDLVTLINWERSPLAIVFRAETSLKDTTSFPRRNDIADCTIYGDNRIVYTVPNGRGIGVLWQRVSDEAIRLFVEDLTIIYQIYAQGIGVESITDDDSPDAVETMTVVVNGQAHRTDAFGGWPENYYQDVTQRCREVADSPAELVPVEAYISAEPITYDENIPSADWRADTGVNLAALSDSRTWLTGAPVQVLWDIHRNIGADVQFRQDDGLYRVALDVPGVTRYSPPPP